MLKKEWDLSKISDRLQRKAALLRRPLSCIFELTYRCNFFCPMCYVRMTDTEAKPFGKLRTADEWIDMARQARDAGVLYLTLSGGECTLFPGFDRLYREVSQMGLRVMLMSNAAAYTDELRQLFREFPPYSVPVTLYGGSSETYGDVTGDPGGLDRAIENIRFFISAGVPVQVNFTVIRRNVRDYPKVAEICRDLGVSMTIATDIVPHQRNAAYSDALNCRLSPAQRVCVECREPWEVDRAMEEAKDLEKELADFRMPEAREDAAGQLNECVGSMCAAAIYWNGDMNTCISMAGDNGTYHPFEEGFEAAWQRMQADRAARFAASPICANCDMREGCVYNCAARNFEGTGNFQTPDRANCEYVWLMKKYKEKHGSPDGETTINRNC